MRKKNHSYLFPIILLVSIVLGAWVGYWRKDIALSIKPLGDVFLHLILTVIVPLIFFSITSAITQLGQRHQYEKLIIRMGLTFLFTSLLAALFMLLVVIVFPPAQGLTLAIADLAPPSRLTWSDQLLEVFTVSDFSKLFSHQNMMPLILFAILVGVATFKLGKQGEAFGRFLEVGTQVFMKVASYIMYYAPIGFFAYFAALTAQLGPEIMENYFRVTIIYYSSAVVYFIFGFSFIAYLAGGLSGVKLLWKSIWTPALTALATCSSAASIPANLETTQKMGISPAIYETVIPLGGILHKDGSVMGGIVKIAFLFGVFHMSFTGPGVFITAIIIALLVGTVMGAIPSGGMLGEMLILSMYGFPTKALLIIAAISLIIDPIATMLNVTCNTVSTMLIARWVEGRQFIWMKDQFEKHL